MRSLPRGDYGEVFFVKCPTGHRAMVNFRDSLGRKRRLSRVGKTKAAAKRALMAHLAEALTVSPQTGYRSDTPALQVVDEYMAEVRQLAERGVRSQGTPDTYQRVVEAQLRRGLADWRLRDFTPPMLDGYVRELAKTSGPGTAKTAKTILSGVAKLLIRKGYLDTHPLRDVGQVEARRQPKRVLTPDEALWFINDVKKWDLDKGKDMADLMLFLLATGCRIGEALALQWSNVNFGSSSVMIREQVIRVKGKGLVVETPKSTAGVRELELPVWGVAMLEARAQGASSPLVFPSSQGTLRDPSNTQRDVRAMRGDRWRWVTTHTFRRTVATIMDDGGATARKVADQLGHARPSMTQDCYMARPLRGDAAEVMDATFSGRLETSADARVPLA